MLCNRQKQQVAYWLICFMVGGVFFASCKKEEQVPDTVQLEVFGPSPVLRGGEIKFIGNRLDRVKAVVLADGTEITEINVVNSGEIRITIPHDAAPGHIILKYDGGEIRTKTPLTYSEPIAIDDVSPLRAKAGEVITIEGEYLNLIAEIIFAQDVVVTQEAFVSQSRKKIEVAVPEEAQTGVIALSNGAEIPLMLYTESEVEIVLPAVEAPVDLTGKKPGDVISISGTDLDLVKHLIVPEEQSIVFSVSEEGREISFTLPENTVDGAVVMIPASGVKVALANVGMATVAELSATPATEVKAGQQLTITGINMELVTEVIFAGTTEPAAITSKSATAVKVTVPEGAVSGDIILRTNTGKEATVAIETAKANVLSYNPNPVAAGTALTITGQHLDVLHALTFSGNVTVEVSANSASSLNVMVPTTAESGPLTATMKNGEQVAFPSLTVDKPLVAYIPVMPTDEIANGKLWIVTIANQDKLTGVQINGQSVQYVVDGDQLYIGIPSSVKGSSVLRLLSSNGDISYTIDIKDSGIVETVIWDEGPLDVTWGDGGRVLIPIDMFNNVRAGTFLKFYFEQKDAWGQAQINHGNWGQIAFPELDNQGTITSHGMPINNDKSITTLELQLTQEILDIIRNNGGGGYGIIIQGSDWIFEKVSIIDYGN
ncbi:hypothetical protein [Parapedobacter composti]|nr:hypothetical protein [Parapedobacter composti]